ncbi:MAG: TlpA family protein disulfide reductase [Candidatus Eremiobacteraeota bacterium]|nr:TlpA family protein disulfide reductase [Candidatus Eremiobacteraeota bacterium]
MRSSFIFLLAALALIAGACAKQNGPTHGGAQGRAAVDQPAPSFSLKDVDGTQVTLAQFKGKPVFINAFATWCPPCKQELPGIVKAYPQYKDRIVFIGIDEQEDAELVIPFLTRFGITYRVLLDPGAFTEAYQVDSLPWSFFIDSNGIVRKISRGFMSPEQLKDNLAAIDKG